ncbi:hypothetical protein ACFPK9_02925 [Rubritalea spongiae]|uniref:Uncharacterized protein n=1 Tax=Rubritalea spongiae TaxID=430797 RepID=A0ABW5E4N8_9BACT
MKKTWTILTVLLLVVSLITVDSIKNSNESSDAPHSASDHVHPLTTQSSAAATPSTEHDSRLSRLPDGKVQYTPALETSRSFASHPSPRNALTVIQQLLTHYRFAYKENPVGVENFEITEQLLGKNPKKIVFIASDSPALRGNELIDQWGTPYFFHALSGQHMDIRSAGPDQTLWTEDDIFTDTPTQK